MIWVLRTTMRTLGYGYQTVEKKMGVAPGYLSRLFRGVIELRFDHVVHIAQAIGVSPAELLEIAFAKAPKTSSSEMRLLTERLYPDRRLREPASEPSVVTGEGRSIEEETKQIERIVLRTFEKFFSSMAKSAGGQE